MAKKEEKKVEEKAEKKVITGGDINNLKDKIKKPFRGLRIGETSA